MTLTNLENRLRDGGPALAGERDALVHALRALGAALREGHPPAHHRALTAQANACAAAIDVIDKLAARYRRNG
ncbi:hypothetical protein PTE30175_05395 [Pandoraea terrae]|uniref:EscE/YscE/SsaE family type III secretion system needle protein co-chaperone n=1 Tax=Pandoraea terrae TaxID=1537710 RepID=A0A5E4ZDS1_9BURK|nr:EscE/YscE/SsaE family type III secretion system needle protein co-chaperone [Pandoraea terrae]VVE59176.1 hypothetical protein PTE30175_05395 [Pandoraea terrae]